MNNNTAQHILSAYRSDGSDAGDPRFKEALQQAERDPHMKAWFEEDQALDQAIRSTLHDITPPEGLKEELLAIPSVYSPQTRSRFRPHNWLALAAGLLLMMGAAVMVMNQWEPALSYTAFPQVTADFLDTKFVLNHVASDVQGAEEWLHAQGVETPLNVPDSLAAAGGQRGVGCAPIEWRNEKIALFCFWMEDGTVGHYFVMDLDALPDAPRNAELRVAQYGGEKTATWTDNDNAYVFNTTNEHFDIMSVL